MKNAERLPPAIAIALSEPPPPSDAQELRRWFRKLSPEFRRQASWTLSNFQYHEPVVSRSALLARPIGAMDPLSIDHACNARECRLKAVKQFARTTGLYAEHVRLGDSLSYRLLKPKFSSDDLDAFATDVLVLHEMRPMIEAGLISFRRMASGYCREHYKEFLASMATVTGEVLHARQPKIEVEMWDERTVALDVTGLLGYPLTHVSHLSPKKSAELTNRHKLDAFAADLMERCAQELVADTAIAMRDAMDSHGTVLSSSQAALVALRHLEGFRDAPNKHDIWECARSAELPWVRDLSIQDLVRLREETGPALERLREHFGDILSGEETDSAQIRDRIHELREQCAEVKSELNALQLRRESQFRSFSGILGLTVSIYGFATDVMPAAPAIASLMTLLGLLHAADHKETADVRRLRSKPGYVLVKAQELLDHAG